jgi:hypothetical protein
MSNFLVGSAAVSPAMSAKREGIFDSVSHNRKSAYRCVAGETPALPARKLF